MDIIKDLSNSTIFPLGEAINSVNFQGPTWRNTFVSPDSPFNCPMANVTFAPGARNSWHKHPGGQILLVTGGKGYYQAEGKPAQVIKEGDTIFIDPDVKHWHGATHDSWLVHIAISTNPDKGEAEWLEPIGDEHYNSLK